MESGVGNKFIHTHLLSFIKGYHCSCYRYVMQLTEVRYDLLRASQVAQW